MTEENTENNAKDEIKQIPRSILNYLTDVFSLKQDKDVNPIAVTESIIKSIEFKGYNVWVLVCSIFIASIGLNMGSIPVIIGAMLISPLMGPIRGIGLAVGTNNFKLLLFSLANFGIATGVSIVISFIYFKITPFKEVTAEIQGRVEPQLLDVLIATFGGLAGIIAASKNDNSTVVPGVAIATALMPPLCVAGFGLATGEWEYFFGAFYLFLLNSIFICLTTILIIRYLKFPLATYVNKQKERKIRVFIGIFLALILIPSAFKFTAIWQKSVFNATIESFINNEIIPIGETTGFGIVSKDISYESDKQLVTLSIVGTGYINEIRQKELKRKLKETLPNCELRINQNEIKDSELTPEYFNNVVKNYNTLLTEKEKKILDLESRLQASTGNSFDLTRTEALLKNNPVFAKLRSFSAANAFKVNMNNQKDTVLLFRAEWNDSIPNAYRTQKLKDFIAIEFENNSFELIETLK